MTRYFTLLIILITSTLIQAQTNAFLTFGGPKNDEGLTLLEKENNNGFLIGGTTRSYGEGSTDYYIIILNKDFKVLNESYLGGPHNDMLKSMIKGDANEYLLFGSSYDFAPGGLNFNITRIDDLGNFINRKEVYRSKVDVAYKIIRTSSNNFIMMGMAAGPDAFGQAKLIKIDSQGEIILEKDYGNAGVRDHGFDILENENGFLILSTNYCEIGLSAAFGGFSNQSDISIIQTDYEGEVLWEYQYLGDDFDYAYSFVQSDENIFIAVNTRSEEAQSFDVRILKLNLQGELSDSFNFGGGGFEYAYKIIIDSNDDLLICGTTSSNVDKPSFYAVKFTEWGDVIWEKSIEENASIYAYDVIERSNGNYLFTGKYAYDRDDSDVFLLELNSNGEIVYQKEVPDGDGMLVYPNPTNGTIIINTGEVEVASVFLYDMMGRLVILDKNDDLEKYISLDLNDLSQGIYILDIIDIDNKHYQRKISRY